MNNDPSSDKSKQTDDENAAVQLNKFTHPLDVYQVKPYETDESRVLLTTNFACGIFVRILAVSNSESDFWSPMLRSAGREEKNVTKILRRKGIRYQPCIKSSDI